MAKRTKQMTTSQADLGGDAGGSIEAVFERNEVRDTFRVSYLANRLVLPVYDDIKRTYELSRGEYLLLFCLSHVDALTAQDVADVTGRPRNSISRAVHRMLDEGYLARSADPSDGRQSLLKITPKGRQLHNKIVPWFKGRERELLSVLTAAERKQFDQLLSKLVEGTA